MKFCTLQQTLPQGKRTSKTVQTERRPFLANGIFTVKDGLAKETGSANAPPTPIDRFAGRTLRKLDRKMATSHRADYRLTRHSPYGLPSSRRMSSSSEFEFEAAILIKERVGLSATF